MFFTNVIYPISIQNILRSVVKPCMQLTIKLFIIRLRDLHFINISRDSISTLLAVQRISFSSGKDICFVTKKRIFLFLSFLFSLISFYPCFIMFYLALLLLLSCYVVSPLNMRRAQFPVKSIGKTSDCTISMTGQLWLTDWLALGSLSIKTIFHKYFYEAHF